MIRCAFRPALVSRAITPPQPNSLSSGCAPKASRDADSTWEFGVGFIGSLDHVAGRKGNFRRIFRAKIGLFARTCNVMRASHNGLHPAQSCIASWTDLLLRDRTSWDRNKNI